ncbi:hypothetical protein LINGRAHAP2_LOCUS1526 [Linum grandiflorum]
MAQPLPCFSSTSISSQPTSLHIRRRHHLSTAARIHIKKRDAVSCCSSSSSSSSSSTTTTGSTTPSVEEEANSLQVWEIPSLAGTEKQFENLTTQFGWRVRRLVNNPTETKEVAQVQAEAFHTPVALFDFLFFEFFKAEVLSGLLYKLRNTTPDRRQKVGSVLLTACDNVARLWGFEYLALQAYADDMGARALYAKAGYRVASSDPQWFALIGRRPRVLMIKRL